MSNIQVAFDLLQACRRLGVREIVLCAGARNAPFVALLSQPSPFTVFPFFEERSGAFFALGKIQAHGRPVAVITTSGTAAAELLPAAIEADYQGLPLLLITADRPRRYRGTGAPQTINQVGIYSHYVERSWDCEGEWNGDLQWSLRRPAHVNLCFDEPLLDQTLPAWGEAPLAFERVEEPLTTTLPQVQMRKPLLLVSGLPQAARASVLTILRAWKRPLYLEAPANLRGHPGLAEFEIRGGEKSLAEIDYDGVIRIGSVPTLRLWRDLEKSSLPVMHFSHLPFSGLPRAAEVYPLQSLAALETHFDPWSNEERDRDLLRAHKDSELLREFPLSEPAWLRWLSREIPDNARIFVGNSLPIREWDMAAERNSQQQIFANRGVNGIDGLISTFLGLAQPGVANWGVIGDLSALYDLSGLWPAREPSALDLNLVIINNGGGKIFHRLFHNPLFENAHQIGFKGWAEMWGWDYLHFKHPENIPAGSGRRVIEIVPSAEQTADFWRLWEKS